jgi:hypothetical protein
MAAKAALPAAVARLEHLWPAVALSAVPAPSAIGPMAERMGAAMAAGTRAAEVMVAAMEVIDCQMLCVAATGE